MLLQAAHTFCVSALYVHVVFDDKHVLTLMCPQKKDDYQEYPELENLDGFRFEADIYV